MNTFWNDGNPLAAHPANRKYVNTLAEFFVDISVGFEYIFQPIFAGEVDVSIGEPTEEEVTTV